jgi:hypothetical protein
MSGAIGTMLESFRKSCSRYWDSRTSKNYRKQPYWALHTHCGKVLMSQYRTFNMRNNITRTINCNNRTAASL